MRSRLGLGGGVETTICPRTLWNSGALIRRETELRERQWDSNTREFFLRRRTLRRLSFRRLLDLHKESSYRRFAGAFRFPDYLPPWSLRSGTARHSKSLRPYPCRRWKTPLLHKQTNISLSSWRQRQHTLRGSRETDITPVASPPQTFLELQDVRPIRSSHLSFLFTNFRLNLYIQIYLSIHSCYRAFFSSEEKRSPSKYNGTLLRFSFWTLSPLQLIICIPLMNSTINKQRYSCRSWNSLRERPRNII